MTGRQANFRPLGTAKRLKNMPHRCSVPEGLFAQIMAAADFLLTRLPSLVGPSHGVSVTVPLARSR